MIELLRKPATNAPAGVVVIRTLDRWEHGVRQVSADTEHGRLFECRYRVTPPAGVTNPRTPWQPTD